MKRLRVTGMFTTVVSPSTLLYCSMVSYFFFREKRKWKLKGQIDFEWKSPIFHFHSHHFARRISWYARSDPLSSFLHILQGGGEREVDQWYPSNDTVVAAQQRTMHTTSYRDSLYYSTIYGDNFYGLNDRLWDRIDMMGFCYSAHTTNEDIMHDSVCAPSHHIIDGAARWRSLNPIMYAVWNRLTSSSFCWSVECVSFQ
jgi:hypothetical protein